MKKHNERAKEISLEDLESVAGGDGGPLAEGRGIGGPVELDRKNCPIVVNNHLDTKGCIPGGTL